MNWFIGILTFFLIIDCLFLILLVLIQLPKKEAGIGMAFGAGATDALFGAGSGNTLTKITKYATGIFFVLTLGISVLFGYQTRNRGGDPREALSKAELAEPLPGQERAAARSNAAAQAAQAVSGSVTSVVNAVSNLANTVATNVKPVTPPAPPANSPQ